MKTLYAVTANEAIKLIVDDVVKEHEGMSRKNAQLLVANALIYNVVTEAIKEQINFLLDED